MFTIVLLDADADADANANANAVTAAAVAVIIMVDHNLSELILSVVKKQTTFVMLL